jgi:hypothetical protein
LLQPTGTATVRQGQEGYEAAPQIGHGAGTQVDPMALS